MVWCNFWPFATTLLVVRILDPADYGVMAITRIWTTTAGMLAEIEPGTPTIQFRDLDRREIDTCFWIMMALAAIACAAVVLVAPGQSPAGSAVPGLPRCSP